MKKSLFILILVFVMAILEACSPTTFDGSRIGNTSQLVMKYKVLNITDYQVLELQEGDNVDFIVTSDSGKLDILFQKDDDEPIYTGVDIPTSSFSIFIEETGSYKVSVTGKHAKGSVSIIKRVSK